MKFASLAVVAMIVPLSCFGQLDPSIPLRFKPTIPLNPPANVLELQQVKLQQQQIELQRHQLEQVQREDTERQRTTPAARYIPPPPAVNPVPSFDMNGMKSSGLFNGRLWMRLPAEERTFLLAGSADSLNFATLAGDYKEPLGLIFPASSTFNELAQGLDRIYAEPENARIPISFALRVFQWKVSGAKEADVTERLRVLREDFAAQAK